MHDNRRIRVHHARMVRTEAVATVCLKAQGYVTDSRPVSQSVVDGAQAGVALVVKHAIRDPGSREKCPDIGVFPVEDGVDAHEGRPAWAAGTEFLLASCIRV